MTRWTDKLGYRFSCVKVRGVMFTGNHNVYMGRTDRQAERQTDRWVGMPSALEYLMLSLHVRVDGSTHISSSQVRCCTVG